MVNRSNNRWTPNILLKNNHIPKVIIKYTNLRSFNTSRGRTSHHDNVALKSKQSIFNDSRTKKILTNNKISQLDKARSPKR